MSWLVELNGVLLSGRAEVAGVGDLTNPPDGLGLPEIRTEDAAYPQRDGVKHFADWYGPRAITLADVWVCGDGCACPDAVARSKVRQIVNAWRRACDDGELVITPPCNDGGTYTDEERVLMGPFSVIGRPRQASVEWVGGGSSCAKLTLRFEAVDQRFWILGASGEPGSGVFTATLNTQPESACRDYDRCYPSCYVTEGPPAGGPVEITPGGEVCVSPWVLLHGPLTNPEIDNLTEGTTLTYSGVIGAGSTVEINTEDGTAWEGGASRTHLLGGAVRMRLDPDTPVILQLRSHDLDDTGTAELGWRRGVLTI